jgi:SAM-dependent methyltransferase
MRAVAAARVVGCDWSRDLLRRAAASGPVVRCRLPDLGWLRSGSVDAAYAVMVIEHLTDVVAFFVEAARVVRPGGVLVVVQNHPAYTPPGAGPIIDQTDGEVLWRWGSYFDEVSGPEPAGGGSITFHHRPMGTLLTAAAGAGWCLERLEERGLGPEAIARDAAMAGQEHMPRLLAARWTRVRLR